MKVTVLGPVAAEVDGALIPLGGRRQRAVFALLALNAGRVVSLDRLVRVLWQDDPPAKATMALQSMVSRLRRVLLERASAGSAAPRIVTRPPGWLLELDPHAVDATRFRAGLALGRRMLSDDPAEVARILREALDLWSVPVREELEIAWAAPEDAVELEQARLDASELLFTADLASGGTRLVVEDARRFVADNPFRERAWMSLSLALYRSGRQADALATIAELRATLAEGLGLDPSIEVLALERQILTHDAGLDLAPSAAVVWPSAAVDARPSPFPAGPTATQPGAEPGSAIVGRSEIFAVLDEVLAQASRGRGRVVVVEGTAGIGKSTVLNEVDARAGAHGGVTVHGAGVTESPAFWPWVVAVRQLVTLVPGLIDPAATSALGTIDPATFPASPSDTDPVLGRTRLYRAVIDLVRAARRTRPLTIVLDDIQALDRETTGLLAVAMAELTTEGVVFVLGLRSDDGAGDDVTAPLLELVRRDSVVRLTLPYLSRDQVAETIASLTRTDPDPAVTDAVWARTHGNPLFVTELVRLLTSEDRLDPRGVYTALPAEVRDVLRRRLDRLPEPTVSLLITVALIGRATGVALLSRVTGRDEDDVVDACEIAVLAGLLVDDPRSPGSYTLSHDLVRQTLEGLVAPARAVRLHARIAQAMQATPNHGSENVVEVARHALLAVPILGVATVLPLLLAAADDALARLALSQAEQYLVDMLDVAERLPSAEQRASIEQQLSSRLAIARIYAKGPTSIIHDEILSAAVSGSPVTLDEEDPTAWFAAMMASVAMGAYARMTEEATRALRPDLPLSLEAMVRLELGLGHFELGHLAAAEHELETTREIVSRGGNMGALVFALSGPAVQVLLGIIAHFHGDDERADAMMAEAALLADGPSSLVVARFGSAWLAAYRGDAAATAALARDCAEVGSGYPAYVAMGGVLAGWADTLLGDAAGLARADQAFADYTSDGTLLHVPMFWTLLAEAHAHSGDLDGARSRISRARSIASTTGEDCLGPRLKEFALRLEPVPGQK